MPSLIAWLRKPAGKVSGPTLAVLTATGFVVLHLFLAGAIDLYIDHDEMQYGQHAVVILDGLWDRMQWVRPNGREGFALVFGPLVTPFFALLGASLMTLRIAYVIFASTWAATWAAVARRLAPEIPAWAVAALFVLPTPFISRYAVSPTAMSTHLGVSTAHGLAVLLLLAARSARGAKRWQRVFGAGAAAGFGTYGGLMMAVLLPGVVVGAAIVGGLLGIVVFALGMLPGLAFAFLQNNPFVTLDVGEYVGPRMNLWAPLQALAYAPGYVPPESWQGNYLRAGAAYFTFVAAVYLLGRRTRACREPMLFALLVSAACLLVSLVPGHHVPWGPTRFQWDALRYTAPLLPIPAVIVLLSCSRMVKAGRRGAATSFVALLLIAHAAGFLSHVSWRRMFEERISTAWIRPFLRFDPLVFPLPAFPDSERHDFYALREGMAAFVADQADAAALEARGRELQLEGRARREYWRGVGRALVLWRSNDELSKKARAWNLASDVHEAVWQGIGMEVHLCDFEHRTDDLGRFVPTTAVERAAYAWGWTRFCTDDAHVPPLLPSLPIDRSLGRRLRWELDLAVPEAPPVSDDDLQQLVFKQWVP